MPTPRHSPFELLERPGATGAPDRSRSCRRVQGAQTPTRWSIADRSMFKPADRSLVISAKRESQTAAHGQWRRSAGPRGNEPSRRLPAQRLNYGLLNAASLFPFR